MATAGDGNGSAPYENSGAGGKLRKRPFRRSTPATPYARPPTAVRNNNPSMLKKLMDPASRLISSDANRLFDVFHVYAQQIIQLQHEVAEIKTSIKLLQEERMVSIEFRKTILDWMKKQDNQFVEDQSGTILPDSKTSSGSKDSSVDLQKLQLSAFNGFEPPRDIPKVNLNWGTHSTPDALATYIDKEMVLPNPNNNSQPPATTTTTTGSGLFGFSSQAAATTTTTTGSGLFGFSSQAAATSTTAAAAARGVFGFSSPAAAASNATTTSSGLFGFSSAAATSTAAAGSGLFGFSSAAATSTTTGSGPFGFSAPAAATSTTPTTESSHFGFSSPAAAATSTTTITASGLFGFSSPAAATSVTTATGSGPFGFSSPAAATSATTTTGSGLFGFSSSAATTTSAPASQSHGSFFNITNGFQASTHASSTSSLFGSSAPAFGSSPSFGVGPISDTKSGNSTSGSTSSIFGSTWQQPQNSSGFGSTFTSPSSSTFTFGASSTPIPSFATAGASNSSFEGSSVFGNSTPVFGAVPATSPNNNNDQTSMEDSMAEDSMQTHSPVSPFGQAPVSAPGFMFGAATPLQPRQRFPSRSKASRTKHRHFRILSNRLV